MDAIEKLRAKGMNDVAAEFMRNRNELIVARRSLLVSHQINEEYRTKLEALKGAETAPEGQGRDEHRLIERCAELTQAIEVLGAQRGELEDKLAQANRSLMLAMRTAQEEANARGRAEQEKAQIEQQLETQRSQDAERQAQFEQLSHDERVGDENAPTEAHDKIPEDHSEAARVMIETLERRIEDQRQALESASVLQSENDALKRQLEMLGEQHAVLLGQNGHAESERSQTLDRLQRLEEEKSALAQQASMSMHAMTTLQADLEVGRSALSQAQQAQAELLARNAELAETIRALSAEKHALESRLLEAEERFLQGVIKAPSAPASACAQPATQRDGADQDEGHAVHACTNRSALGALLEQTIFKNVLPDAAQMHQIRSFLSDTTGGQAMSFLIEIEKGKLTRRILRALSEEEKPEF